MKIVKMGNKWMYSEVITNNASTRRNLEAIIIKGHKIYLSIRRDLFVKHLVIRIFLHLFVGFGRIIF